MLKNFGIKYERPQFSIANRAERPKRRVIIFGKRDLAQLAHFYFSIDSNLETVAFTVDDEFMDADSFQGLPVVPFSKIDKLFDPSETLMFAPMTQAKMGAVRKEKYLRGKEMGFEFATYVSSWATYFGTHIGENTFIFEDNTIQPFVNIGNNVILWSGNHIGHHSTIEDHVFITSHVVVSGHCKIEKHCFLGVNSTIRDYSLLREGTLIAMGAVVGKETSPYSIHLGARATIRENAKSTDIM